MNIVYTNLNGEQLTWIAEDQPRSPLDFNGVTATLNVVLGVWSLEDAANAAGLSPEDLIAEAEAWAVAMEMNQ